MLILLCSPHCSHLYWGSPVAAGVGGPVWALRRTPLVALILNAFRKWDAWFAMHDNSSGSLMAIFWCVRLTHCLLQVRLEQCWPSTSPYPEVCTLVLQLRCLVLVSSDKRHDENEKKKKLCADLILYHVSQVGRVS